MIPVGLISLAPLAVVGFVAFREVVRKGGK
jgi:hypothetical protein